MAAAAAERGSNAAERGHETDRQGSLNSLLPENVEAGKAAGPVLATYSASFLRDLRPGIPDGF